MKKKITLGVAAIAVIAAYSSFEWYTKNSAVERLVAEKKLAEREAADRKLVEKKLAEKLAKKDIERNGKKVVLRDYSIGYQTMETAPVVLNDELLLISFERPSTQSFGESIAILDKKTNEKLYDVAWNKGLGSAIVDDGKIYVFGSSDWSKYQNCIYKAELSLGEEPKVINEEKIYCAGENKRIFNTTVARDESGFVIAFEVDEDRESLFYTSFLKSKELSDFKIVDTEFRKGTYTACPTIRYSDGYYHLFYLDRYVVKSNDDIRDNVTYFRTMMSYSKDLKTLGESEAVVFLDPKNGISPNNSDMDMIEFNGSTQIFFAESDQKSWATVYRADFNSSLSSLLSMLRDNELTDK